MCVRNDVLWYVVFARHHASPLQSHLRWQCWICSGSCIDCDCVVLCRVVLCCVVLCCVVLCCVVLCCAVGVDFTSTFFSAEELTAEPDSYAYLWFGETVGEISGTTYSSTWVRD
jgi:hypothetical protein